MGKVFAGKTYQAFDEFRTKTRAQEEAKKQRNNGYCARVSKGWGGMWIVYRRK